MKIIMIRSVRSTGPMTRGGALSTATVALLSSFFRATSTTIVVVVVEPLFLLLAFPIILMQ
jgi:hypothetical protein